MKQRIQVIDGLRGIAILGVIWHHLYTHIIKPGYGAVGSADLPFLPFTLLSNGWLGVNLFFLLSGFVLYAPYVTGDRHFSNFKSIKKYYINRAKRLLPLYYFCVIYGFIFIYQPESNDIFIRHALLMLTATFNFTSEIWFPPYNWVMWSLGIEIWFSILFPLIVVILKRVPVLIFLAVTLALAIGVRYAGLAPELMTPSPYLGVVKDSLLGRLDDFVLGMFTAWFWFKSPYSRSDFWGKKMTFVAGITLIFITSHLWDYFILKILPVSMTPLLNTLVLAGLFLTIMHLLNSQSVISKLFRHKYLVGIGVMCYSLYLWHGVLIDQILGMDRSGFKVVVYLVATFVVSALSYEYIERNKLFRPKR